MGAFDVKPPITIPDPSDPESATTFRKKWGWDPHEQVLIKGTIDVADQEYVTNLTAKSSKRGEFELQAGTGRYALLDRMIQDWTLLQDGHRVPVSKVNIRRLPANYANPILEEIDKLAAGMTEEEQDDFLPSANGYIVDSSERMTSSLQRS